MRWQNPQRKNALVTLLMWWAAASALHATASCSPFQGKIARHATVQEQLTPSRDDNRPIAHVIAPVDPGPLPDAFVPQGGTCRTCGFISCHGFFCPNDGQPFVTYGSPAVVFQQRVITTDAAIAGLNEIFTELQERFHDHWDWMEAAFYVE